MLLVRIICEIENYKTPWLIVCIESTLFCHVELPKRGWGSVFNQAEWKKLDISPFFLMESISLMVKRFGRYHGKSYIFWQVIQFTQIY